jgi:hypothetical protein
MTDPREFSLADQPEQALGADRVREHTDDDVLRRLDDERRRRIADALSEEPTELTARIEELEGRSDVERVLEMNAASLALGGVLLGAFVSRRFLVIPAIVLGFLLQHAIQGWCPPLTVLRRRGVLTRRELETEKAALRALRGDFSPLLAARRT